MSGLDLPLGLVLLVCAVLCLWRCVNDAALRAERVYRARHRDHSKVPAMAWKVAP